MKKRRKKRGRKMPKNVREYLAAIKRSRREFGPLDREEHEAIKRYHRV